MEQFKEGPARTIGAMLDDAAARFPQAQALVYREKRLTYSQLKRPAGAFAKGLMKLGIKPGQHIVLWLPNCLEWNSIFFAIAKAGAVIVTANSRYSSYELQHILKNSDATSLIMAETFAGMNYLDILNDFCPEFSHFAPGQLKSERFPSLKNIIVLSASSYPGTFSFQEALAMGEEIPDERLAQRQAAVKPEEAGIMFYTSGTTGLPKGCLLSHEAAYFYCRLSNQVLAYSHEDVILAAAPYFHMFGMYMHIITSVLAGARQVIMDMFNAQTALELIQQEKVTVFNGIPTMFILCLERPDFSKYDLTSLKKGMVGGATCPVEVMKKIMDKSQGLGMDAINAYALTESGGPVTFTQWGDSLERRTKTIGKALAGIEIKVVDPQTGKGLPPGQPGEILIKSPGNMLGYYKNPQATEERLKDGWLHTGDLAVADEEGYLKLTGRISDIIITGGFNVYPREIEEFLFTHPKIQDASVVGVPDRKMGEVVMAFIVPKLGEKLVYEEVAEFAQGKVANFKVPRYVEFVESLPYVGVGKVQKFKLRNMAIEKYHLEK